MKRMCRVFPLLALLLAPWAARARIARVDRNAFGMTQDGASWSTAYHTIASALSGFGRGTELWVAKGTYTERVALPENASIYGGFAGTEMAREQRDWKANPTIIDAASTSMDAVICAYAGALVDGVEIRSGRYGVFASTGSVTLNHVSISGAFQFGVSVGPTGAATVRNSVITGCVKHGVYISSGTATLTNTTIAANTQVGVYPTLGGKASVANCIVAFNGTNGVKGGSSNFPLFSHNDVAGNTGGDFSGYTPPADQGNLNLDPLFLDQAGKDFRLKAGSPCVNAGDDSLVAAGETDRDGLPRLQGAHVDIGAHEAVPTTKVIYVDRNAPGTTQDGTSWATAYQTLAGALGIAGSGDELWVAEGTYTERITPPEKVSLYGGFAGGETARGQRDWKASPAIIDTASTSLDAVTCQHPGLLMDGFEVRGGRYGVNVAAGTAALRNLSISGAAQYGIYVEAAGAVTAQDSVLSGNSSDGVYVSSGSATLRNLTIAENGRCGVYVAGGAAGLTNCVVAFNHGYGVFRGNAAAISAYSHNAGFQNTGDDCSNFTPPADAGNFHLDPQFIDRPNGDFRLKAGSPCIDAGDDAVVVAGETDRDGLPRIRGARVDIGAYEYAATGPTPYTLAEAAACLKVASGLSACPPYDFARLNVVTGGSGLDLSDALRLARKVAGLEPNP